jgi:hypothetical protein
LSNFVSIHFMFHIIDKVCQRVHDQNVIHVIQHVIDYTRVTLEHFSLSKNDSDMESKITLKLCMYIVFTLGKNNQKVKPGTTKWWSVNRVSIKKV